MVDPLPTAEILAVGNMKPSVVATAGLALDQVMMPSLETFTVQVAFAPDGVVAVMVTVPSARPVTVPPLTLAMAGSDEVQVRLVTPDVEVACKRPVGWCQEVTVILISSLVE